MAVKGVKMNKLIKIELQKHKIGLFSFLLIYITDIILSLLEPVIFGKILDIILENAGMVSTDLINKIVLLGLILLLSFVLTFLYRRIIFSTGRKVKQGVLFSLLQRLESANIKFLKLSTKEHLSHI